MTAYLSLPCANCNEPIFSLAATAEAFTDTLSDEFPVVPTELFTESRFTCTACGVTTYTGELDTYVVEPAS